MKQFARRAIQTIVDHAPWGVRNAMLEACLNKFGISEVSARIFPRLGIAELGVWGDLGLVRSSWNDREILAAYARAGATEARIVDQVMSFFGTERGTYIDVGANIGLTTIPIARNPNIRCLAFEPEPGNFRFLKLNVETNVGNPQVEFYQNAVAEKAGTVSLALAEGNLGDHRITVNGIPGRSTIDVAAIPLDEVLGRVEGRLAVKVDTQGAEPAVVAGGRAVLARAGLVALEFCPYLMRQMGSDPEEVIALVGKFHRVALIDAGSDAPAQFGTAASAQSRLRDKVATAKDTDGDYFDIVACRDE